MTRIGPDKRSSLLIRRPPGSRDRVGTTIARASAEVRSRDRGRTHLSISRCSLDTVVATLVVPAVATIEAAMTGLGLTIVIIAAAPAAVAIIEITGTAAAVVTTIAAVAMTEGTIETTGLAAIETIVITGIAAVSMRRRVEHLAVPVAAAIGTSARAAGSTASLQTLVEEAFEPIQIKKDGKSTPIAIVLREADIRAVFTFCMDKTAWEINGKNGTVRKHIALKFGLPLEGFDIEKDQHSDAMGADKRIIIIKCNAAWEQAILQHKKRIYTSSGKIDFRYRQEGGEKRPQQGNGKEATQPLKKRARVDSDVIEVDPDAIEVVRPASAEEALAGSVENVSIHD